MATSRPGSGAERDYLHGFANQHETEALPGALPVGRNSPQRAPYGLYAEKLSGTAFTAPRESNRRSWLYRIRPSVACGEFSEVNGGALRGSPLGERNLTPNPLRWDPFPVPEQSRDFVEGWTTVATNGDLRNRAGIGIHLYLANRSMENRYCYNADGELLVVPQQGRVTFHTEFGVIDAAPGEIVVVPRGVKFNVELPDGPSRGYICENYGAILRLPERGPIGTDGLANERDFLTPVAAFEDREGPFELYAKFGGRLFVAETDHSPLDVVAWHGNLTPYKYELARFSPIGSVGYDHPDPSIFTVLTSPSDTPGIANVDFVIFPPRWLVMEDTFRPAWYHRNVMSEFMGLIHGVYDAKTGGGFQPGGASLHNAMVPHGPDAESFERASAELLEPRHLTDTMAFMFESRYPIEPTDWALTSPQLQPDYRDSWSGLESRFTPDRQ